MSDIVERLRIAAEVWGEDDGGKMYAEAGHEIARLRSEVEAYRADAERWRAFRVAWATAEPAMTHALLAAEKPEQVDAAIDTARNKHV